MALQDGPPSIDLQQVFGDIATAQSRLRDTRSTAQTNAGENEALRVLQVSAAEEMGKLSQQQLVIDQSQALEAERRKAAVASVFGTDILDPQNRIAYLARERDAQVDSMIVNSKRAQELSGANLFDSPFEYLVNRPFLQNNVNAAAAAKKTSDAIDQEIARLNQDTTATVATQAAIQQTFTQEEAAIQASVTALKAADAVRQLRLTQNTAQLADLKQLADMDEHDVKYTVEAYKLQRHEDEFQLRMEEMRAKRKERKDEKLAAEVFWRNYITGAKALGRPTSIRSLEEYLATLKLGGEIAKNVQMVTNHGGMISGNSPDATPIKGMENFVAASPGEAHITLKTVDGALTPAAKKVADFIQAEAGFAQEAIRKSGGKMTAENWTSEINTRIKGAEIKDEKGNKTKVVGSVNTMAANPEQDLQGGRVANIYRAPDVNTMGQAYPKLTQTTWWKEIIEPASRSKPSPDAQQVVNQAMLAVKEGKISPEVAAGGISAYYSAAVHLNNKTARYLDVGLPDQKDYPVVVTHPISGDLQSVSAMNHSKLLHHLMLGTQQVPTFGRYSGSWR